MVGDIDLRLFAVLLITLALTRGGKEESLSACNSSLLWSGRWGRDAGLGKATRPPWNGAVAPLLGAAAGAGVIGRMQPDGVLAWGVPGGLPTLVGGVVRVVTVGGLGALGRLGTGDGEDGLEAVGEEVGELRRDFTSSSSSSSRVNSSKELLVGGVGPFAASVAGVSIFFTFSKLRLFTISKGTIESLSFQSSRFCFAAALVDDGGGEGGRGRELMGPKRATGFLRALCRIDSGLRDGGEDGLLPVDGDAGFLCGVGWVGDIGLEEFVGDIGLLASGGLGGLRLVIGGVGNSCHEDLPPTS